MMRDICEIEGMRKSVAGAGENVAGVEGAKKRGTTQLGILGI